MDQTVITPEMLYHGTGIYCLAGIVADNVLHEGIFWGKRGEPHGPRLTNDYEIARDFIEYNMPSGGGGVLVLDGPSIAERYELVRYQDAYFSGEPIADEAEYVPLTSSLVNINDYLCAIVCPLDVIEKARSSDWIRQAQSEAGWPYGESPEDIARCLHNLDVLAAHPKRVDRNPQDVVHRERLSISL